MAHPIKRSLTAQQILAQRSMILQRHFDREARRAKATRELVSFPYLSGDLHTHSRYSDGSGTVTENWAIAKSRGHDFLFATDHGTVRQKVECKGLRGVWWGQEPGAGLHHIGILDNPVKFTPCGDLAKDADRLRKAGWFWFIAHPSGWMPRTWRSEEAIEILEHLGGAFAMEVFNGFSHFQPCFTEWQEADLRIWDRLLCKGFRVIGLGASDAHAAPAAGCMWTGIPHCRPSKTRVIEALRSGRVFASMGPAIDLNAGRTHMGGEARPRAGRLRIRFEAADAYGLNWARVIVNGGVIRRFEYRGAPHAAEEITVRTGSGPGYVRVECAANDDRRACTNPIYLKA